MLMAMTEAGDKITDAMRRHQASINSARDTANALAVERERETEAAVKSALGRVDTAVSNPRDSA